MQTLFDPGREGFADGSIDWDTNDIRVMLVKSAYTFDIADKFLSDIPASSQDNGRSAALGSKTVTNGVLDAADESLVATSNVACNALVLFQHSGNDSTARLIAYLDGRFRFTIAAGASGGATAVDVDALKHAIASGKTATKISGTGPATIVLSAGASAGAHSISVNALSGAIAENDVYEVDISGSVFPFTPGAGQTVNIPWDNGPNKILKV